MTLKQLRQRRDKGITFLDTELSEWREIVNKDKLDMSDGHNCIAGQVTGMEYDEAIEQFGLSKKEAFEYAFYTGTSWLDYEEKSKFQEDYAKLTKVWTEVL